MLYLEHFTLPIGREGQLLKELAAANGGKFGYIDNPYPCGLFGPRELKEIRFRPITVFYGGNGSGKSTLLNLIAAKLELNRIAPYNSGEMFGRYVRRCKFGLADDDEGFSCRIPNGSRIITSDDIFDYMLTVRTNNNDIAENRAAAKEGWAALRFGETVKMDGLEDYEAVRLQVLARSKSVSRRQFIRKTAGEESKLCSNGETALKYFKTKLRCDTLYCLDEPENSMSPAMQLELVKMLEELARCCGCQFIIATHSPFLLAMEGARIYDLDARPAAVRDWWELENVRAYFELFEKHRNRFLTAD